MNKNNNATSIKHLPTAPDGLTDKPDITGGDIEVMRRSIAAKRALVLEAARGATSRPIAPDELTAAFEESWKRHEAGYRYLATEGMSDKELRAALAEAQTEIARLRALIEEAVTLIDEMVKWDNAYDVDGDMCVYCHAPGADDEHRADCEVLSGRDWLARAKAAADKRDAGE